MAQSDLGISPGGVESQLDYDKLCQKCAQLFADAWENEYTRNDAGVEMDFFKTDHHTIASLREAADDGCHLCALLCEQETPTPNMIHSPREVLKAQLTRLRDESSGGDWYFEAYLGDVTFGPLTLVSIEDTESVSISRRNSSETFSEHSVALVKTWINECINTHPSCRQTDSDDQRVLPSRLLEINREAEIPTVRLVETKNISHTNYEYLTLSHCWGGVSGLKLVTENFSDLSEGIDFNSLPQSFQDAITLTCALGMTYLWIDCFCILQNDPVDWAKESAKMGQIYHRSILTIAATDSSSCHGGLFAKRPSTLATHPCKIDVRRGKPLPKGFIVVPPSKVLGYTGGGPLNRRGWVLQERLLSKRLLQCSYTEFHWECPSLEASETFPDGILGRPSLDKSWFCRNSDQEATLYNTWVKIREIYSDKELTVGTDKLIAFSGIAQMLLKRLGSSDKDYLAGLWKPQLARELLWRRRALDELEITVPNDTLYRAPSWSWAQLDGRISFSHFGNSETGTAPFMNHLEIFAAEVTAIGDPFGQVSSGVLRIQGPLCSMLIAGTSCPLGDHEISMETLFRRFAETSNRPPSNAVVYDEEGSKPNSSPHIHTRGGLINKRSFHNSPSPNFWFHWDEEGSIDYEASPKLIYWMPVSLQDQERLHGLAMPHPTGKMIEGLMLEPVAGQRGRYARVGVLEFPAHFDVLDRSLHSNTLGPETYLEYDGREQFTIEIV